MVLVHGPDELFVRDIVRYLTESGEPAQAVAPDAHMFSEVVEHRPRIVIGVVSDTTSEDEALDVVQALTAASSAPQPPTVVLVTPAEGASAHVLALKRSGAAYVIVRASGLDSFPLGHLRALTVWISREALAAEHAPVTKHGLLQALAQAVRPDMGVGIELRPERDAWDRLLSAARARVRVVPNWVARTACWCGGRALYVDRAGRLNCELGREQVAQALGAVDYARA